MTEKELKNFKEVLQKNGIPCRETPRTKEEMANLICIYNTKTDTIALKPKDYVLTENEVFIPIKGLCEDYPSLTTNENMKKNDDELIM